MKYEDENGEIIEDNDLPVWILPYYNRLNNRKKKELKVKLQKKDKELGLEDD